MANQSNCAQIRQDGSEVVLTYVDPMTGDDIVRRFWAPASGGYVREVTEQRPGALGKQVCGGLSHYGPTLSVSSPDDLIRLIRREWQVARRAEARFLAE